MKELRAKLEAELISIFHEEEGYPEEVCKIAFEKVWAIWWSRMRYEPDMEKLRPVMVKIIEVTPLPWPDRNAEFESLKARIRKYLKRYSRNSREFDDAVSHGIVKGCELWNEEEVVTQKFLNNKASNFLARQRRDNEKNDRYSEREKPKGSDGNAWNLFREFLASLDLTELKFLDDCLAGVFSGTRYEFVRIRSRIEEKAENVLGLQDLRLQISFAFATRNFNRAS